MAQKLSWKKDVESSLVKVRHGKGSWGTGFIVEHGFIITACHCLPRLPDPMRMGEDHILLQIKRFSAKRPEALVEAAYLDPCGDVAVLRSLDNQAACDEAEKFERIIDNLIPLKVNLEPLQRFKKVRVHVRTFRGEWLSGEATVVGHSARHLPIRLDNQKARISGGTSGSPVFDDQGNVIGVMTASTLNNPDGQAFALPDYLPYWIYDLFKNGFGFALGSLRIET